MDNCCYISEMENDRWRKNKPVTEAKPWPKKQDEVKAWHDKAC